MLVLRKGANLCFHSQRRRLVQPPLVSLSWASIFKVEDGSKPLSFILIVLQEQGESHSFHHFKIEQMIKFSKNLGGTLKCGICTLIACWYMSAFLETLFKSDSFFVISESRPCGKRQVHNPLREQSCAPSSRSSEKHGNVNGRRSYSLTLQFSLHL